MMSQEIVEQMQMIEHNLQHIIVQKQSVQSDIQEIETALEEVKGSSEGYVTIGNIMVKKQAADIQKDLDEKKKTLQIRLESIAKQEQKLEERKKDLQEKVMKTMGEKDE
jgi:prefoldin beta subunit